MAFWIIAAAIALAAALISLRPVWRTRRDTTEVAASDVDIYRQQLKDIEADAERGTLSAAEAKAVRAEVARRLLAAAKAEAETEAPAPVGATAVMAALTLAFLIGGSLWAYSQLGAPGREDMPLAARQSGEMRPGQETMEARLAEDPEAAAAPPPISEREASLLDQLREVLKDRPDDLNGHVLLVRSLASVERNAEAWRAQTDVLRILGDDAGADDHATLAELMIFAVRGYVSPEAEAALATALELDPENRRARYYSGAALAQNGDHADAMATWDALLLSTPEDQPWKEPVREQMRNLAETTGTPLPATAQRGPTREDMEAAGEMSAEERAEMIRGMVEGLADRLATEGGPPEDWARLIGALAVLGESDRAKAILAEAQETFANSDAALTILQSAAARAGLSP